MSISHKIENFLKEKGVQFDVLHHPVSYTAQHTAGVQHVPGDRVAKCVIVHADGNPIMCVIPATYKLNWNKLQNILGGSEVHLATEEEMEQLFPQFELGAEPPIHKLCKLPLYIDSHLEEVGKVLFNGGTHTDLVRMKTTDFLELAEAEAIEDFGDHI